MDDDRSRYGGAPPAGPAPQWAPASYAAYPASAPTPPGIVTPDEKNMAMLAHIAAFAAFVVPLGSIIGPLVVWLVKREGSAFVDFHGKQALNFNITLAILGAIFMIPMMWSFFMMGPGSGPSDIFTAAPFTFMILFFFVAFVVWLYWFIGSIVHAVAASKGERTRYALAIPFLR